MPRDGGADEVADLWAMAAELERQFAGYKQRLAERNGRSEHDDGAGVCVVVGNSGGEEEEVAEPGGGDVRGRMYEAYVRRRDERLRQGWRERMERKEAEVKAFWAQLELSGRAGGNGTGERTSAGGGGPKTTDAGAAVAGDEERKIERNDDDRRRSSDAALAPRRISGKKHARTRSFSSSNNTGRTSPDPGRRRAVSQEPPPSEPQAAGDGSKDHPARPAGAGGAAATTKATSRPKTTSLRRKKSVKGHGFAKQTGPKLPRSLPRRPSSGGLEDLGREVAVSNADAAGTTSLACRSSEHALHGQATKTSPPMQFTGDGTGVGNAQAASPDSERSEVVDDAVTDGEPEVNNAEVAKRGDKEVDTSRDDKLGNPNGEITSDSDVESSYVYINKDDVVEKQAVSVPGSLPLPDAVPEFRAKTSEQNADTTTAPPVDSTAADVATTNSNAGEAPARESSDDSSFSGRLGRSAPNSAAPSCSSRDHSIERLLEADAALLRKKREARAEKSALGKTPGSAGSRVSSTGRSPNSKETPRGFKRFLSFGKKNRTREVTVIDCASPSVSSVADDDSGGWQSAGSIKPRMGSSDAASDDTDHGHATSPRVCSLQSLVAASPAKSELAEIVPQVKSPKANRSFFSFRSLNCGRG